MTHPLTLRPRTGQTGARDLPVGISGIRTIREDGPYIGRSYVGTTVPGGPRTLWEGCPYEDIVHLRRERIMIHPHMTTGLTGGRSFMGDAPRCFLSELLPCHRSRGVL